MLKFLPMKELQSQNKEQLISGFKVFLNKHLKPGDMSEIAEWTRKNGAELNRRFPIEKIGSYSDKQFREVFELMSVSYGGMTSIGDQEVIMSKLLDCGVSGGRVLSIGCGLAPHEIYLATQGLIGEVVGVDTSSGMVKKAREMARKENVKAKFVQDYGSSISYKNEFDQVLIIDSLHWMRSWKQCLVKSTEALKNNGAFFLIYSILSPAIQINPAGVSSILKDHKIDIVKQEIIEGHAGTPRAIIFGKKI
jgi:ubiquinone/menaquinone biosynthesis C-methylase UbiE